MTFERHRRYAVLEHRTSWLVLAGLLLLLLLAPVLARAQAADSTRLRWTAPGDDGTAGSATAYEVRRATFAIDAANFALAPILAGAPAPLPGGTPQSMVVRGLSPDSTYWFEVRAVDESGNWAGLSNVVRYSALDPAAPAAPIGLAVQPAPQAGLVHLAWSPNTEPDLASYRVQRALSAAGPWTTFATLPASVSSADDAPPPVAAVWYAVIAVDRAGNASARSAAARVMLPSNGSLPAAWAIRPPYPNPARTGELTRILVEAPSAVVNTRLDLYDAAGRRVRHFELGGAPAGILDLTWDGRGESGQACAPGVYRLLLSAPGVRITGRVTRIP